MSTEPNAGQRTERRHRLRFRNLTLLLIGILVLAAAGLAGANAVQGPRLSSTSVNPEATITRAGQRLLLQTNQPIDPIRAKQWSITPATDAEVTVQDNTITVRFAELLKYNTEYTVTIDVRGEYTGAPGQLQHAFTTPDVDLYSLRRDVRVNDAGEKNPDRILRNTLSGSILNDVAFNAPRIQEYAVLKDALAVITLEENDNPSLLYVSFDEDRIYPIATPRARTIRGLQASGASNLFGYILSTSTDGPGPKHDNTLFVFDLASSSGIPLEITGVNEAPLPVMDWVFVPGTSSLVAQGNDQQLYLINPLSDDPPVPLGQHGELRGFIPGTTELIVADPDGGSLLDLAAGTKTPLQLPEADIDPSLYPDKFVLRNTDSYFQKYNEIDYASSTLTSALFFTDPTGTREVFRPASDTARIGDYCLSPNNQYLAVVVISPEGEPDDYPVVPGSTSSTTYFVKIDDGSALRGVYGFMPSWCE